MFVKVRIELKKHEGGDEPTAWKVIISYKRSPFDFKAPMIIKIASSQFV